jgi:2-polyprenyl-3-methyl-5-hydroxy-6-metoxy-1,4-benzoquinol methylase
MQFLDYVIQSWRMRIASSWIPDNSQVLDIGCHQGEFLEMLEPRLRAGSIGLDPLLQTERITPTYKLQASIFDDSLQVPEQSFDVIVMLAVFEHLQEKEHIAQKCFQLLRPHGRVIVTVPSLKADKVIDLLVSLRLVDGMSLEQHHGFEPDQVPGIFEQQGFHAKTWKRFQLGLNNLFVFERNE